MATSPVSVTLLELLRVAPIDGTAEGVPRLPNERVIDSRPTLVEATLETAPFVDAAFVDCVVTRETAADRRIDPILMVRRPGGRGPPRSVIVIRLSHSDVVAREGATLGVLRARAADAVTGEVLAAAAASTPTCMEPDMIQGASAGGVTVEDHGDGVRTRGTVRSSM